MITTEQLEIRKNGIGSSDASTILKLNPYCTPYQLWLNKTGQVEEEKIPANDVRYIGNLLEETIAKLFSEIHGLPLEEVHETLKHPDYPWMICHIDRKVIGKDEIVECKNVSLRSFMAYQWGNEFTDQIPLNYLLQVQHQLAITDYKHAYVAVLVGGSQFKTYEVNRDEKIISTLIEKERYFWEENVLKKIPPEPLTEEDIRNTYPSDDGNYRECTQEIIKVARDFFEISSIKKKEAELKNELCKYIGEYSGIKQADKPIVTFKASKAGYRTLRIIERNLYEYI
jgi:putative phage-type endonuclease